MKKWKWSLYIGVGLIGLILVAVLVLVAMGFRSGAGSLHATIAIDRPPQTVWPWLNEPERLKAWVSWLVEVRATPRGQTWIMVDPNMGDQRIAIDRESTGDAPRHLEVRMVMPGGFSGTQTYDLTDAANGGTTLTTAGIFRYDTRLARLLEPLISAQAQTKLEQDLARLKAAIESAP
jgi:uncharacterized protein YndB with AHSA1/START domain